MTERTKKRKKFQRQRDDKDRAREAGKMVAAMAKFKREFRREPTTQADFNKILADIGHGVTDIDLAQHRRERKSKQTPPTC